MDACRCRCVSNARVAFVVVVGSDERPGSVRAQHVLRGSACRAVYRVSPMLYVTSLPQRSLRLRATDRWSAPSSWIPSTASRPSTNTELKAPPPPRRPHIRLCAQLAAQHANMRNGAKKRPAATTHRCPQGSPVSLVTTSSDSVSHTHARERESLHITDERSSVKTIRAAAERNEATAATGARAPEP